MCHRLVYLLVASVAVWLLAACQTATMSPTKFRQLSLDERLSYCEANRTAAEQRDCLAIARTEPGYPETVEPQDIKLAADLCREQTPHETLDEMALCVAWKLNLADKHPGPDYRRRHLKRAAQLCTARAPSVDLDLCISNTLPYVVREDYDRYKKEGN